MNFIRKKLKIEDKMIPFSIYDLSSNEKLLRFFQRYSKNSACEIFVYDIKNKKSFQNVPNYLEKSQNNDNKRLLKVLVGNKIDDNENRQEEDEEGIKFAEDHHMLFFETSAKNNINVKKIFTICS